MKLLYKHSVCAPKGADSRRNPQNPIAFYCPTWYYESRNPTCLLQIVTFCYRSHCPPRLPPFDYTAAPIAPSGRELSSVSETEGERRQLNFSSICQYIRHISPSSLRLRSLSTANPPPSRREVYWCTRSPLRLRRWRCHFHYGVIATGNDCYSDSLRYPPGGRYIGAHRKRLPEGGI